MEIEIKNRYHADVVVAGGGNGRSICGDCGGKNGRKDNIDRKKQHFRRDNDRSRSQFSGIVFCMGKENN